MKEMDKMTNIAFLSTSFLRTGIESTTITTISLAKELINKGYNVTIITPKIKDYPEFEKIEGVPIYRLYKNKILCYPLSIRKLRNNLGIEFDIIHGFSAAPILSLGTYLTGIVAKTPHTIHTIKSYSRFNNKFARILNTIKFVTTPTKVMKEYFISVGVKEEKVKVIRSFIRNEYFHSKKESKKKLRKKYNIDTDKKVILYYGSLLENKGPKLLLEAFSEVLKEEKCVYLVIASRHSVSDNFRKCISDLKISENIKLIEGKINVIDFLHLTDIVALPYIDLVGTEGNPSCLIESMATKTPTITTSIPELKEIVRDHGEVLMAKPGNKKDLKNKILELIYNPKLQKRLTHKAYIKSKEFDIKKSTEEFTDLYNELIKNF